MTSFKKYFEDNKQNIEEHEKKVAHIKKLHPSTDVIAWVTEDPKTKEERVIVEYHPLVKGQIKNIHRKDGPARLTYSMSGALLQEEYYLVGNKIKKQDFDNEDFVELYLLQYG